MGEKEGRFDEKPLRGLFRQIVVDGSVRKGCIGVVSPSKGDQVQLLDGFSGDKLYVEKVREARREEWKTLTSMRYMKKVDLE